VRSRGHVNRKLAGLLFEGRQDAVTSALMKDGQNVGKISSTAYSYGLRRTISLGMIRHESAEPGTQLQTAAGVSAEVTSLPFFYPMARSSIS
jgi:glycine cleavage system aminomethyltransferase T